jgi:endonuclease/exonuclease/phosphatase family metal-dependent hydrolase
MVEWCYTESKTGYGDRNEFDSIMMSPMVRIDYIFVSEHFIPQETHVLPSGYGSDHRPVVAMLRFAR